jgi:hypothetical protein
LFKYDFIRSITGHEAKWKIRYILLHSLICSPYFLRYIGQIFESGETDGEEEPVAKREKIVRDTPDLDELGKLLGEEDPEYRPDDPSLYDQTSFEDSLVKSLKEQAKKFTDVFKTDLFRKGG